MDKNNIICKIKSISLDTKRVIVNSLNSLFVKGGSLFVALFTTPAYMRYFDNNIILGVWFTMLSLLSWVLNFDMGIGNGLRNKLVKEILDDNKEMQKKYISSAYIFLLGLGSVLFLSIVMLVKLLNWNKILNVSINIIPANTLKITIFIVLVALLLQFVFRLITSILYALQLSFIPNLLSLITSIIMLIYVVFCNYTQNNNNIISLAINYLIAVNLPLIITTFIVFTTKLKQCKPNFTYFEYRYAKEILKVGSAFLILQFAALIINNTTIYLINLWVGPESVVEYNIYNKIFSQVYTVFSFITIPIWSAITKAIAEKKYEWIEKTIKTLRKVAIIMFISQFMIFPIQQKLFDIWLGKETIKVNYFSTFIFICNNGIMLIYTLTATICNGLNELKNQMKLMVLAAIMVVPVSYISIKIYESYISMVISNTIVLIPYCILQSNWLNKHIKELKTIEN